MSFYRENIKLLFTRDPILAQRVERIGRSPECEVVLAREGSPVPVISGISLHSQYDPIKEASQIVDGFGTLNGNSKIVFGLGFGYHLDEILKTYSGSIFVIEPSLSLFKEFLGSRDLKPYLERVIFIIGETPVRAALKLSENQVPINVHPATARIHSDYLKNFQASLECRHLLREHSLKILLIPPIYGGSLPTAHFCKEALEELGHKTGWVDCESFADGFFALQNVTGNKEHATILSQQFLGLMEEIIVARAVEFQPDIILGLAQAPMGEKLIRRLQAMQVPIAFWFVEDFRTLTYWKETAGLFDHFFTIQKDEFFKELDSAGVQDRYYLPQAGHPPLHHNLILTQDEEDEFGASVSFMGAAYYNRLTSFAQLLDLDLKIWGTGWDPNSIYGPHVQMQGARVSSEDCVRIFNGGRINLNLHSSTFHEGVNPHGDFVNPRTFEIASCGAFQLVDNRQLLPDLFALGTELVTFNSIIEMKDLISHYLENPEEARHVALQSQARVLKEHSFRHRMQEMLLHIFTQNRTVLEQRLETSMSPAMRLIEQAGPDSDLKTTLEQFKDRTDLSIQSIVEEIHSGEGDLSKNELLLLMVDQVVK